VLADWRVIDWLNALKSESESEDAQTIIGGLSEMTSRLEQASGILEANLTTLGLPFIKPAIRPILLIQGRH
jgi:hypothetical protein